MGQRPTCLIATAALLLAAAADASDLSTILPTRVKIQVHGWVLISNTTLMKVLLNFTARRPRPAWSSLSYHLVCIAQAHVHSNAHRVIGEILCQTSTASDFTET